MVWLRVQKTERMSTDSSGVSCLDTALGCTYRVTSDINKYNNNNTT